MISTLHQHLQTTSLYLPFACSIESIQVLTEHEKLFKIQMNDGVKLNHEVGQFVEVSLFGIGEAPISISSSPSRSGDQLELCIRRAGTLTSVLHTLQPGDQIGLRGPFGRGLPLERFHGKDILIAPGGLGLAPMRSLIHQILDHREHFGRLMILYGAKHPSELLFKEELSNWGERHDVELQITVDKPDDDWKGNIGVITTLFSDIKVSPRNTIAVICGPPVMYRFVLMELLSLNIPEGNIWLNLERRMKCGVGKCGHCQLDHLYTCRQGPSFTYTEIKQLREAFA